MNLKKNLTFAVSLPLLAAGSGATWAQGDQERIERLEEQVEILEERLDATADAVEEAGAGGQRRSQFGGYGELHYNNFQYDGEDPDDEIDFHRFVLFFAHQFTDDIRFFSELELEHSLSGDDKPGEVELEQAFIEFDLNERTRAQAGLFLLPIGIINETHEPTTFYGVERNRVESEIIPTTWWEGGGQIVGQLGASGFSYNFAIHSGLEIDPADLDIRDGRQKVAEAIANDFATTGALAYTGIAGLEIAGSVNYQDDVSQQSSDDLEEAILYEAHVVWGAGPFGLRALYAHWDFEGDDAENVLLENGAIVDKSEQFGYYIEPSFEILPSLGVFARYGELETADDLEEENLTVGANWWPHPQVVFKVDYQWRDADTLDGSEDRDSFNAGVGYVF